MADHKHHVHFLSREIHTKLNLFQPDISKQLLLQQEKQEVHHDAHTKEWEINIGQQVIARNYHSGQAWLPATVTHALSLYVYKLEIY